MHVERELMITDIPREAIMETPHLWQQGARATDYIRRFVLA